MISPAVLLCGPVSWGEHRDALTAAGHRVTVIGSILGAVDQCRALRPAVVVLDAGDPSGDVHDTCRRLRAMGSVPIIVAARTGPDGMVDDATQLMCFAAGADDVVNDDGTWRVMSEPSIAYELKEALEAAGFTVDSADTPMFFVTL